MGGICNPPVVGSGVLPIIGGGPDRVLYENAAQLLDTDADFLFTGAPVAPDFNNMQIPLGGGLYLKAANGLLHWNNASGLTNTGTDSLSIGGGQWQSLSGYNFSFTGATVMNMSTSTLTFTNGGATNAGQITAAGDWWFGLSDPGGADKVRVNGSLRTDGLSVRGSTTVAAGVPTLDFSYNGAVCTTIAWTAGVSLLDHYFYASRVSIIGGAFYFSKDDAAQQLSSGMYGGAGAPSNVNGANGDFYFRSDGGLLTTIYQKQAGAWVGIV